MYPLKLVFMIGACSFAAIGVANISISERFGTIYFKDIKKFFARETDRNIEIKSGEKIDLAAIPTDDFKYYKGIMLLYCKIIDNRFLNGQRPIEWSSLEELEHLQENYNKPPPFDEDLHDEHNILRSKSPAFQRLATLSFDLVVKYDAFIQPKGYIDMAFYYNVLTWLKSNFLLSPKVSEKIKHIQEIKNKARNYFHEFIPLEKIYATVDFSKDEYKTVEGWKDDKYSTALAFIIDMLVSKGEAAKTVPIKITDIAVYEEILNDADRDDFYHAMRIEKWDALWIVDNSFRVNKEENLSKKSLEHQRPHFEDINLSNLKPDSIQYFKNAAILFVEALERRTKLVLLTEKLYIHLDTYSERNEPNILRYCTFQWWFIRVVEHMEFSLSLTSKLEYFAIRTYIFRLVGWLMYQIKKKNNKDECNELTDSLGALLTNLLIAANPSQALMKNETMMNLFNSEFNSANSIDQLLVLGEKHDKLIASMLYIVIAQMENDLESYKQIQTELEEHQKPATQHVEQSYTTTASANKPTSQQSVQTHDHETDTNDQEPSLTVTECEQNIDALKWALFKLEKYFGKIHQKIHCKPIHEYEELANLMDNEENFPMIFFNDKNKTMELIKMKIAETCVPGNVQVVGGGTKEGHDKSGSFEEHTYVRPLAPVR